MFELPLESFTEFKETKYPEEKRIRDLLLKSLQISHPDLYKIYKERWEMIKENA